MYNLQTTDYILAHGWHQPWLSRDFEISDNEADAQDIHDTHDEHSDTSLIAIVTAIDKAENLLTADPATAKSELEKSIRTLLYLYHHYKLVPKIPDHLR